MSSLSSRKNGLCFTGNARGRHFIAFFLAVLLASGFFGCAGLQEGLPSDSGKEKMADELHDKGLLLWNKGQYEEAIEVWRQEIEIVPERPRPYNNIGMTYRKMGQDEKAVQYHEKAIKADPTFGHSYYSLGLIYYDKKDFAQVAELMSKAVVNGYSTAESHFTLGQAYRFLGELEKAAGAYEKTIDMYYGYPAVHFVLGEVYRELGKYDKARLEYQKEMAQSSKYEFYCRVGLLETDAAEAPDNPDAYFEMGKLYGRYRNLELNEKGFEMFEKVLEIDPEYPDAHYELGNLYEAIKDTEAAKAEYLKEMELHPGSEKATKALRSLGEGLEI